MKTVCVKVEWPQGLHLRLAAKLVRVAQGFRSRICVRSGPDTADGTSVLSLLILRAGRGAQLTVQASGVDEHEAISAVRSFFEDTSLEDAEMSGVELC
jgi:phosphotransferase system HPr (HPr) family protein